MLDQTYLSTVILAKSSSGQGIPLYMTSGVTSSITWRARNLAIWLLSFFSSLDAAALSLSAAVVVVRVLRWQLHRVRTSMKICWFSNCSVCRREK
jgi:hypothetical protein